MSIRNISSKSSYVFILLIVICMGLITSRRDDVKAATTSPTYVNVTVVGDSGISAFAGNPSDLSAFKWMVAQYSKPYTATVKSLNGLPGATVIDRVDFSLNKRVAGNPLMDQALYQNYSGRSSNKDVLVIKDGTNATSQERCDPQPTGYGRKVQYVYESGRYYQDCKDVLDQYVRAWWDVSNIAKKQGYECVVWMSQPAKTFLQDTNGGLGLGDDTYRIANRFNAWQEVIAYYGKGVVTSPFGQWMDDNGKVNRQDSVHVIASRDQEVAGWAAGVGVKRCGEELGW